MRRCRRSRRCRRPSCRLLLWVLWTVSWCPSMSPLLHRPRFRDSNRGIRIRTSEQHPPTTNRKRTRNSRQQRLPHTRLLMHRLQILQPYSFQRLTEANSLRSPTRRILTIPLRQRIRAWRRVKDLVCFWSGDMWRWLGCAWWWAGWVALF